MKKIFAVLLSVMMLLGMLAVTAFADESADETMIPVVVQVPEGWGTPNLWAWADDGTNAFAAWPGEEMDALAEGWYYTYVPGFVQNVIVNANQGTDAAVQTEGIVVEAGKEVWITVAEDRLLRGAAAGRNSRVCGKVCRSRLCSPVLENRESVGVVGAGRYQRL